MSDREESPDWLRSYQAPSASVLSLSSGSELSGDESPTKDDDTDLQTVSVHEKSDGFGGEEDDQDEPLSKVAGRPSSSKSPGKKTPNKRLKAEDLTPSGWCQTGNDKRRGSRSKKIIKEDSSEIQMETDVKKRSIWSLSSDSSEYEMNEKKEESEEDDDDALIACIMNPASKGDTSKKKPQGAHNTTSVMKKTKAVKVPKEEEKLSDEASVGSGRHSSPGVASKGKSLKKKVKDEIDVRAVKLAEEDEDPSDVSKCQGKAEEDAAASVSRKGRSASGLPQDEKPPKRIKTESDGVDSGKKKASVCMDKEVLEVSDTHVAEEGISGKQVEHHVTSSKLPLILSEKVQYTKALVECEGDSIDVSGDIGAVGRVIISNNPSTGHEMFLDLKGTVYKTSIVPCRTFCVVTVGQTEAKIDAVMNDFIQLRPQSNVYDAETMVEGTLDGFTFDSEDEAEQSKAAVHQNDQSEGAEEQGGKKAKGKPGKKQDVTQKKGKTAAGKQPRKRKAQASKRVRGKK